MRTPSTTALASSGINQGQDPLATWRQKLSAAQCDRILAIVHQVGITAYSDALEPDELALTKLTPFPDSRQVLVSGGCNDQIS
ncbi:MAG: hypothetical protein HC890_17900 [Chloroflexaceae bacterium]|nr:hypothetical protein [Chloroflexaceae bacterium]